MASAPGLLERYCRGEVIGRRGEREGRRKFELGAELYLAGNRFEFGHIILDECLFDQEFSGT